MGGLVGDGGEIGARALEARWTEWCVEGDKEVEPEEENCSRLYAALQKYSVITLYY